MKKILITLLLTLNTSVALAQNTSQDLANSCGLATSCLLVNGQGSPSFSSVTASTGFAISGSGTLSLQEATAGTKCMGTLTLTAATPVVTSTTCAKTASRIFLTRTSIDADTTGDMAVTAISDGVSFSVTSEASDTGTVNWIIFNESP